MAFADDFSQCLAGSGINIPASAIPEHDTLQSGLNSISSWIASLDSTTQVAVDEVTADFPTKAGLADPNVNIAPELLAFLQAFDSVPASLPISTLVQRCNDCLQAKGDGGSQSS
ncbi:MAG TPA: hypothetical protein VF898_08610 [Chloroflexota bacterium]